MPSSTKPPRRRHGPMVDALPEMFAYRDTGCKVSPSCLQCPLPRCKYDDPAWYRRYRLRGRNHQVWQTHQAERATIFELAHRFGVSPRTIHRVLSQPESAVAEGMPETLSA
jgi:hypothetical protein